MPPKRKPKTKSRPTGVLAEKQLASFLSRYTSEIDRLARALRTRLRAKVPGGIEFIYDNYNALVIGYGPTERPSEAVLSLALYPRSIGLCFLKGARLPDPDRVLKGSGNVARHVVVDGVSVLESPPIKRLVELAIRTASPPFPGGRPSLVIQSISAKQRPRRAPEK